MNESADDGCFSNASISLKAEIFPIFDASVVVTVLVQTVSLDAVGTIAVGHLCKIVLFVAFYYFMWCLDLVALIFCYSADLKNSEKLNCLTVTCLA